MIKRILKDEKEYILIGTAHISKASALEVEELIGNEKPDVVAVELCQGRFENLNNENRFDNMDIADLLKKGQGFSLLANFLLSAYQKRIGNSLGIKPGAEMIAAIDKGREVGARIEMADRDINITLKRVTRQLRWKDKFSGLVSVLEAVFSKGKLQELDENTIEELKNDSVILDTLDEMGIQFPNVKRYLLDERDSYMAYKLSRIQGNKIVAVVGAGHLNGIYNHLQLGDITMEDMKELKRIPPKSRIGNGLALVLLLVFAVMVALTIKANPLEGIRNLSTWILLTATLGGMGTFLAGGHPFSILAAMIGSPIGAASPILSGGLIGALVEAKVRKPRGIDFNNLSEDAFRIKRWRKNRLLRVFLIFILGSLGSGIGNILGLKSILTGFLRLF